MSAESPMETQNTRYRKTKQQFDAILTFTMVSDSYASLLPYNRVPEWLRKLSGAGGHFCDILRNSEHDSVDGYRHTIREICQQPATWPETARRMRESRAVITQSLSGCQRIVLTGSGSSQFAGECVAPALRKDLGLPIFVRGGGALLLGSGASFAGEPTLVISLARSGESPESVAVVRRLLETEPRTKHLIITCNSNGRLAREFTHESNVSAISLSEDVHDRSLVMTSSFTNLAFGARFLGWLDRADAFETLVARLDFAARQLLTLWPDQLKTFVSGDIHRILFLGDECRLGGARESALKMLEMTGGRVATMAETYLGLRHGPMCFVDGRTLVVCYVSSDPLVRSYEQDLIAELDAKGLGARKLVVGVDDPGAALCKGSDLAISYDFGGAPAEDADLALLDVMIGQILGFHRCREEGLQPDSPSESGVISRVVGEFQIHLPERTTR
jgi:tagatose-6-phosphate ketose/aldose isomerase